MEYKGLKIGIFTITDAINYGAFYQMFAMASYLEKRGATVTVYKCKNSLKRKLIKYLSYNPLRQIRKIKFIRAFQLDGRILNIKRYNDEKLDLAILGSDEIWNLDNRSFEHSIHFYGLGINANKIIAYAPSIGFAKFESLLKNIEFCRGINRINTIMARDENTQKVAQLITGKPIKQVVDPTILFDDWENIDTGNNLITKNYILYYGYTSNPPFKDSLIKFAEEQGLMIVSAGYNVHKWCDKNCVVGPFGFLNLMRGAKFVFTTTFHGTVMATLLNKHLFFYGSGQKVVDFSEKLKLKSQHIDQNSLSKDMHLNDKSNLNKRSLIEKLRDESRENLRLSVFRQ